MFSWPASERAGAELGPSWSRASAQGLWGPKSAQNERSFSTSFLEALWEPPKLPKHLKNIKQTLSTKTMRKNIEKSSHKLPKRTPKGTLLGASWSKKGAKSPKSAYTPDTINPYMKLTSARPRGTQNAFKKPLGEHLRNGSEKVRKNHPQVSIFDPCGYHFGYLLGDQIDQKIC